MPFIYYVQKQPNLSFSKKLFWRKWHSMMLASVSDLTSKTKTFIRKLLSPGIQLKCFFFRGTQALNGVPFEALKQASFLQEFKAKTNLVFTF